MFEHRKDDVAVGVRFRKATWQFIEAKMHNRKYNPSKRHSWGVAGSHLPSKSVHTVLDELLRKLMEAKQK